MIKVNLVRDQTTRIRKTRIGKPDVSRTGLALAALFTLLVAGIGGWWYSLDNQIKVLTTNRDRLRVENARLQQLRKEIDEFEKLKRLRQSRIDVIEKLKEIQTGPVRLLNHVISSIPREDALWLTLLDHKGDRVQITGYAARIEAIPDFMTNLSRTELFKSVDLELVEEEKDAARFSLVCMTTQKVPTE